ncbi:hypothetical protein KJ567_05480, partial [Candidatus Bipolaricaulota bacterium]|nr:hypothetical protein [Candidatus Bipolaricaulota bacterium]
PRTAGSLQRPRAALQEAFSEAAFFKPAIAAAPTKPAILMGFSKQLRVPAPEKPADIGLVETTARPSGERA